MSDAAKLAWMLIYLQRRIDYLKENLSIAYEEASFDQLEKQLKELAPIIDRIKDEEA